MQMQAPKKQEQKKQTPNFWFFLLVIAHTQSKCMELVTIQMWQGKANYGPRAKQGRHTNIMGIGFAKQGNAWTASNAKQAKQRKPYTVSTTIGLTAGKASTQQHAWQSKAKQAKHDLFPQSKNTKHGKQSKASKPNTAKYIKRNEVVRYNVVTSIKAKYVWLSSYEIFWFLHSLVIIDVVFVFWWSSDMLGPKFSNKSFIWARMDWMVHRWPLWI